MKISRQPGLGYLMIFSQVFDRRTTGNANMRLILPLCHDKLFSIFSQLFRLYRLDSRDSGRMSTVIMAQNNHRDSLLVTNAAITRALQTKVAAKIDLIVGELDLMLDEMRRGTHFELGALTCCLVAFEEPAL